MSVCLPLQEVAHKRSYHSPLHCTFVCYAGGILVTARVRRPCAVRVVSERPNLFPVDRDNTSQRIARLQHGGGVEHRDRIWAKGRHAGVLSIRGN